MARKKFSTLTEPMFYLLMSLHSGKKCGIDISEYISQRQRAATLKTAWNER